jgi:Family of unknown function (DUF5709)
MSENDGYSYGLGEYATEGDQQVQSGDSLDERGVDDILDEGYSPPEKWSVLEKFGNTAEEEREGETLDQKLAEEVPDPNLAYDDEEDDAETAGPASDLDLDSSIDDQQLGEDFGDDQEVGDLRAGRLVSPDEGAHADDEKDLVAGDVGIDGAAASAEEAAVHVVED